MYRHFKSLEAAEAFGAEAKKKINHANFRAKSIKADGEGDDEVVKMSGYASTKDRDRYGDIVEPKAFKKTMKAYMTNPMLLLQHNMDKQIGVVTAYEIDDNGLLIDADVKYTAGDPELFDKITNGDLKGFSIGFRIRELEFVEEEIDGEARWTLYILELELLEISVVTIPANPFTLAKSLAGMIETLGKEFDAAAAEEAEPAEEAEAADPADPETPADPAEEPEESEEPEDPDAEEDEDPENPEDDPETPEDPEKDADVETPEDTPENPEIDTEDPADIIDESPTEEPENPEEDKGSDDDEEPTDPETPENEEEDPEADPADPDGEPEEEKSAAFTLKAVENIVKGHTEQMEKTHKKEIASLKKEHEKKLKEAVDQLEQNTIKAMEGMFEMIREGSKSTGELAKAMANLGSGKGFIYTQPEKKSKT